MKEAAEVIRDLARTWNGRHEDRIGDVFAEDARFEDVAFGVTRTGLAEIEETFRETWRGIPDLHTELTHVVTDGERVAAEWVLTGTHSGDFPDLPATGNRFSVAGVSCAEVRDGKIRSQRDYYDRASFLEQLGVLSASDDS